MHIEPRLLVFTKGIRWRIAGAVALGLVSVGLGVARLGLLGWLRGDVLWPTLVILLGVYLLVRRNRGWGP